MALTTIKLYGDLGEKFGKEFQFEVHSPAEAVRLLAANFKGFTEFFVGEDLKKQYHVYVGKQDLDTKEIDHPVSPKEVIKIVPVVAGGTENPFIRIIVGVVLVVAAAYGAPTASIGWGLIIGGVSQVLFAPPTPPSAAALEVDENMPSYNFDGPVNTVRQGNPVPVGYGRLRVGSQVISAGFYTERIIT
jgi:predicted phage tail protein